MEPTKFDYWWDQNVTMRWHEFLCNHNYHRIVWESAEGYEHCHCGEAIKDTIDGLLARLEELNQDNPRMK